MKLRLVAYLIVISVIVLLQFASNQDVWLRMEKTPLKQEDELWDRETTLANQMLSAEFREDDVTVSRG